MAQPVQASVGWSEAVTESDTTRFAPTDGLAVAVAGSVAVLHPGAKSTVVHYLLAGVFYPIRAIAVYDTGTDASLSIRALYFDKPPAS